MQQLQKLYKNINTIVDARLKEFALLGKTANDIALFAEMCFCTCTPQTNAHHALNAVRELQSLTLLERGQQESIAAALRHCGVRFHNNKAAFIVKNRALFFPRTKEHIETQLLCGELYARNVLAQNVYGWGLKEASHFLRNIGHGKSICILDRHILRCLTTYGVIEAIPKTLSPLVYCSIEQKMKAFAAAVKIPVDALDLVFWYQAKGEVFK
jgi:N-glycosylase/DNA lyase